LYGTTAVSYIALRISTPPTRSESCVVAPPYQNDYEKIQVLLNAKVQCVVARAAPATFIDGQDANYFLGFREKERMVAGSIEQNLAIEASPISHVTSDDAPILLVHGDADETVLFSQSEHMLAKLQMAGVPAKLLRIEGGGHGFNFTGAKKLPDLKTIYVQWMDTHLRNR